MNHKISQRSQRPSLQSVFKKNILTPKNNTEDTIQSIAEMITLLKNFEIQCQKKQDFEGAESAKNKLQFLKSQEILLKKEKVQQQNKQNLQQVAQLGDMQIKQFEEKWEGHIDEVVGTLKQSQAKLLTQHELELQQLQELLNKQEMPKIKYSSKIIQMRNHLQNSIKIRNYKEAQFTKNQLQKLEKQELKKWKENFQIKKKNKIQYVKKKQQGQLQALRIKLEAVFNEQVQQRNIQFEKVLKKNRKRMIQTGKTLGRERASSKYNLLNQSKAYIDDSKL